MTDPIRSFYRRQADLYEHLVARQDGRGNLFAALNEIRRLDELQVVEFGAGTGNLTRLLAAQARRVFAFDIEPAMLMRAQSILDASGMTNWSLAIGDNARMPVASHSADLVIEGWSFGHVLDWHADDWRRQSAQMLAEMRRILKPGGVAILIEDLGVGLRQPQAPGAAADRLYAYWREERGYAQRWIRTDYHFASPAEADKLTRFFFGNALADAGLAGGKVILPECTGIWWKHFD